MWQCKPSQNVQRRAPDKLEMSGFSAVFRPSNILVPGDKDAAESEEDSAEMKSVPIASPDLKI